MPIESPDLCRKLRPVSIQIVSLHDRAIPGAIILRYLDASLLEVNIDCDHSTRIKDIFFVLFLLIRYLEPFPWYIFFQGYGRRWLLH